ncbi:MAG: hypothetical protein LBS05_09440 [Tannerellaceae bacterium]|jgi:hypothetical protein|nr:hypothetical protein [Tannerellaceae bacterium]
MAYNRHNLFARILEIKAITYDARKKGQSQRWAYENLVRDRYHISYSTYNKYLSRAVLRETREEGRRRPDPFFD